MRSDTKKNVGSIILDLHFYSSYTSNETVISVKSSNGVGSCCCCLVLGMLFFMTDGLHKIAK